MLRLLKVLSLARIANALSRPHKTRGSKNILRNSRLKKCEKPLRHGPIQVCTQETISKVSSSSEPAYTEEQINQVVIAHREAKTLSDKVALTAVKILRWGLDFATGYKHERAVDLNAKDPKAAQKKYAMTEEKYLIRNVFLESVAGVPGMVAGMIRHLHSMRRMKRDNGWYMVHNDTR